MAESKERNATLSKELKEAQNQRKLAMAEFSELNDKLAEMRSQKTKLTRSQREKEEELGMCEIIVVHEYMSHSSARVSKISNHLLAQIFA